MDWVLGSHCGLLKYFIFWSFQLKYLLEKLVRVELGEYQPSKINGLRFTKVLGTRQIIICINSLAFFHVLNILNVPVTWIPDFHFFMSHLKYKPDFTKVASKTCPVRQVHQSCPVWFSIIQIFLYQSPPNFTKVARQTWFFT